MTILVVLVVAAIIAGLYVWTLMGTMSNVAHQEQANVYVVEKSFQVHKQRDQFMYSNVIKTPIPQNNGGGGGRGGRPGGGPGGRPGGGHGGGPRGGGRR